MKTLISLLLVLGVAISSGCNSSKPSEADDLRLRVVCTTGMIGDMVTIIGGEHVNVKTLMGPGVDPHLFRASAGNVKTLSRADIIFYNGLHLEAKMGEVLEKMNQKITTVPITKSIPEARLRSPKEFEGFYDPHVWFDVSLWAMAIPVVRDNLIQKDPAHREDFEANAKAYAASLAKLHAEILRTVEMVPTSQRVLITAHDAFGYFGDAYGFTVKGLQGISTESEAGAKDVQSLANFIAEQQINAMFVETSVPKRNVEAVQAAVKSRGWDIQIGGSLFSDAMGAPGTPEGHYIGMVRHNVHTIVSALTGMPDDPSR